MSMHENARACGSLTETVVRDRVVERALSIAAAFFTRAARCFVADYALQGSFLVGEL